jgi:hypothetical protein
MAEPKNDKHKDYSRYAARCLEMTGAKIPREDREVLREMTIQVVGFIRRKWGLRS